MNQVVFKVNLVCKEELNLMLKGLVKVRWWVGDISSELLVIFHTLSLSLPLLLRKSVCLLFVNVLVYPWEN